MIFFATLWGATSTSNKPINFKRINDENEGPMTPEDDKCGCLEMGMPAACKQKTSTMIRIDYKMYRWQ
jgi:hypothetical protein